MIVFVEDSLQLKKFQKNYINNTPHLIFWYKGRRITRIQISQSGYSTEVRFHNFVSAIKFIFSSDEVITEYANFLPRLFTIICRKKISSLIFGKLVRANFRKFKYVPHKLQPLVADKYVIFGRQNPTRNLIDFLSETSEVLLKERSDMPDFRSTPESDYILYIGQAFEKDRMEFYDAWEHMVVSKLDAAQLKLVYCRHPRSLRRYDYSEEINGYSECIKFIEQYGRPKIAISMTSSLIFELKEMGVNAVTLMTIEATNLMHTSEVNPDLSIIAEYVD